MSWQTYVDQQICERVKSKLAIIASVQDGSIWAQKKGQEKIVTQQELKVIIDTMKTNPDKFLQNGIHLGGEKYISLAVNSNLIRARKDSAALCIVATKSCLLVVVTEDGFPPGTLNTVVEKLGEYLLDKGY